MPPSPRAMAVIVSLRRGLSVSGCGTGLCGAGCVVRGVWRGVWGVGRGVWECGVPNPEAPPKIPVPEATANVQGLGLSLAKVPWIRDLTASAGRHAVLARVVKGAENAQA